MNLIVTANGTQVCFETRVDYTKEQRQLFLANLAPWVRNRVTCASPLFYADIPLKIVNEFLPYGLNPVRFLWDVLIDAHYQVTNSSLFY